MDLSLCIHEEEKMMDYQVQLEKEKLTRLQKSTQHLKQQQPSLKPSPVRWRLPKFV